MLQLHRCFLMSRNILPTGAALMYTLDEICVLSLRIFFNSLTYQANKLLEKVNVNLWFFTVAILTLGIGYFFTVEKLLCSRTISSSTVVHLTASSITQVLLSHVDLKFSSCS